MFNIPLTASIALLALASVAIASPLQSTTLQPRQATLPPTCTDFYSPESGNVCITRPTNCLANYTVTPGESCGTVVDRFANFTATDLYAWNPEIRQDCTGLRAYVPVCIGVPNYVYPGLLGPVFGGRKATANRTPVPVQPGIVANCGAYQYTDSKGEVSFAQLLSSNHITQQQWNTWNWPGKDPKDNWAVFAGYWSCIALKQ
ncbi:carbohydrate-binding module family 50 protein [Karstenula rhodostoma CBS 690.94]|uniref:Carbohydrate-binding module family 50 protein n=1 Tax=Karstenula rhodostoma CBS 690.94 TaxID=1392251 RepID=A0A9P4PA80_9PLEO|nr:carbohydrate-binding module family 50 protein [Karstenula rhodostoma CBS 690.94]